MPILLTSITPAFQVTALVVVLEKVDPAG